jgi:inosine-uridine nucleoside N-ribohydrolase
MLKVAAAAAFALVLLVATFAVPLPVWRTGELPAPPLSLVDGGPEVSMSPRVWIDTDASCGHSRTSDSDDCFALLLLARRQGIDIAGISTVFGNESLAVTDRTTRQVASSLGLAGAVHRGSAGPTAAVGATQPEPAHAALRRALEAGPLTLVALGPLTNIAATLEDRPDLQANVSRLVAVMGRRPGHLFHPSEGGGGGILFGHGPVFRDLNFDKDRAAASAVLAMGMPTTLTPYEAARDLSLTAADLTALKASGEGASLIAARAEPWLDFWKTDIGRTGFYPFDLIAAAYAVMPDLFDCAEARAWVGTDDRLWNVWFHDPPALLVEPPEPAPGRPVASAPVIYCATTQPRAHRILVAMLAGRSEDD